MSVIIDTTKSELESVIRYARICANNCMIANSWEVTDLVRCKDCKYWDTSGYELQYDNDGLGWCEKIGEFDTNKDWFCGWGERRRQ